MSIEIINNLHIENTPNNKNEYGKKICPITMQTLSSNNCIKIDEEYNIFVLTKLVLKLVVIRVLAVTVELIIK
jgi:hypothetical protein